MKNFLFAGFMTIGLFACSENHAISQNKNKHHKKKNDAGSVSVTPPSAADTNYQVPSENKSPTIFGALIAKSPLDKELKSLKTLGVGWTRCALRSDIPDGVSKQYLQLYGDGNKVILNFNWGKVRQETGEKEARPFPTNLTEYKSNLNALLSSLKSQNALPEIVVIENEPTNLQYYSSDMKDYLAELKAAVEVCHKFGVKVADGALHPEGLYWFTYQDYLKRGLKDSAKYVSAFLAKPAQALLQNPDAAKSDARYSYFDRVSTLLFGYKDIDLDYVNVHFYYPKSFGNNRQADMKPMIDFYRRVTGKPVISNEWSTFDTDTVMLLHAMREAKKSGLKYAIFFSEDGKNSTPLTDDNSNLSGLGAVYRRYFKEK